MQYQDSYDQGQPVNDGNIYPDNAPIFDPNDKPPLPPPLKHEWISPWGLIAEKEFVNGQRSDRLDCADKTCYKSSLASAATKHRYCSAVLAGRFEPKMPAMGFRGEDAEDWKEMNRIREEQKHRALMDSLKNPPPPPGPLSPPTPTPGGPVPTAPPTNADRRVSMAGRIHANNVRELNDAIQDTNRPSPALHPGLRLRSAMKDPNTPCPSPRMRSTTDAQTGESSRSESRTATPGSFTPTRRLHDLDLRAVHPPTIDPRLLEREESPTSDLGIPELAARGLPPVVLMLTPTEISRLHYEVYP